MTQFISIDPHLQLHISDHPSPFHIAEAPDARHARATLYSVRRDLGWAILRSILAEERRTAFDEPVSSILRQAARSIHQDPALMGLLLHALDAIAILTYELAARNLKRP